MSYAHQSLALASPRSIFVSVCLSFLRVLKTIFLVIVCLANSYGRAASGADDPTWRAVRDRVPGHFQDWIVAGKGPEYTLVYTEPPPAFSLQEYGRVLKDVFRGYKSHTVATRPLGYNGRVNDLVINLDYSFDKHDPFTALEDDVAALSTRIYGTSHGARVLPLAKLEGGSKLLKAPLTISVSAGEFDDWLIRGRAPLALFSPELNVSGTLASLTTSGPAGRYLSSDNSLVILLVDQTLGITHELIPHLRAFAIDSDLILGGVAGEGRKFAALIGRSRQLALAEFPALRVEDMVNAMVSKDANWAQSYDRMSPGAGRAVLADGSKEDWAPSFLSADLIDTEFGSLLNQADAILKSQSLSDVIRYRGYPLAAFPKPPYPEGVFDHLFEEIGLSSLVFNFNTVGVGHWLATNDGYRVYALNSSGSFSVTYSPDTTGRNSTLRRAGPVEEAERTYTEWFRRQQSRELIRTVQYMAIYQVFSGLKLGGIRLYPDPTAKFRLIGQELKESVKVGASASLASLEGDEREKLASLSKARDFIALLKGLPREQLPEMKTLDEVTAAIATAAGSLRYDGNLFGDRHSLLAERETTLITQYNNTLTPFRGRFEEFEKLGGAFAQKYKAFERGKERILEDGEFVTVQKYLVPNDLTAAFEREEADLKKLFKIISPVDKYLSRLRKDLEEVRAERRKLEASYVNRELMLEAVQIVAGRKDWTAYPTEVLKAFAARTGPEKFAGGQSSISTPTVVVSADKSGARGRFVGGHNVEVQKFTVRLEDSVPEGTFRLTGGELWLNRGASPKLAAISERMARAADSDPATQQRVFESAIKADRAIETSRRAVLGLDRSVESARFESGTTVEAISSSPVESGVRPPKLGAAVVVGRDARSQRLYYERVGSDGNTTRVAVLGARISPEIISGERFGKESPEVTEVILDESLRAGDIEAIIASYKNRPGSGGGGDGDIPPISRWHMGPEDRPGGPRLVLFTESRTGRQRAIVETSRGRVELLIPENADGKELVTALKTQVEAGARLELSAARSHRNRIGAEFLLVGFEVVQATSIKGRAVAHAEDRAGLLQRGGEWLRNALRLAFLDVQKDPNADNTAADFIVEVNRRTSLENPGWKVEWKVEVGEVGMRFVLEPSRDDSIGGREERSMVALERRS